MADALVLRNHLIEQFERADAASDSTTRRSCLTVVVIGGGLVGVELLGELTAFADDVLRFYPRIRRDEDPLPAVRGRPAHSARDRRASWRPWPAACSSGAAQTSVSATPVRVDRGRASAAHRRDHRGRYHRAGRRHRTERHRERNSGRARSARPNRRRRDDAEPQPSAGVGAR